MKPDEKELGNLKKFFHQMGLTARQAKQMQEYSLKYLVQQKQTTEAGKAEQAEAGISALRGEWGDKFSVNVDTAKAVLKKFGDEEVSKFLEESGLGNNAPLVKLLYKIGGSILEDSGRRGDITTLPLNDASRAAIEIENLRIDKDFQEALGSAQHPGHSAAVTRWTRLFSAAHPGSHEA